MTEMVKYRTWDGEKFVEIELDMSEGAIAQREADRLAVVRAQAAKAAAIRQADENADRDWKELARLCVLKAAHASPTFTTDDVWPLIEARWRPRPVNGFVRQQTPAALGPVMLALAKERVIVQTGRRVQTRLERRHRDLVEWRLSVC